jgi:tRNA-guanine family transglycosylase
VAALAVRTCTTSTAAAKCSAPMLTTVHNLHYYLNLMREVRESLEAGQFGAFRAKFKEDRARGV